MLSCASSVCTCLVFYLDVDLCVIELWLLLVSHGRASHDAVVRGPWDGERERARGGTRRQRVIHGPFALPIMAFGHDDRDERSYGRGGGGRGGPPRLPDLLAGFEGPRAHGTWLASLCSSMWLAPARLPVQHSALVT